MNLFCDLEALPEAYRGGAVAIGNFDGVHRGHAHIARHLIQLARQADVPAVVFTFEPHPGSLLRPDKMPPPLTTIERKAALLGDLGVDAVVAYPTDMALLQLTPREFFQRIIVRQLRAQALVEGPDFCFGRDRAGTIDDLRRFAAEADIRLELVDPVKMGDAFVSSSRARRLLTGGDVESAAELLGRPYRIEGRVARGAGRGRQIGFPTANLSQIATLLPGEGVYAGSAMFAGKAHPAAINIGPNPTFGESGHKIEAHLIGFDGPLYDEILSVDFVARLRDVRRFDGADALQAQLKNDVAQVRQICKSHVS